MKKQFFALLLSATFLPATPSMADVEKGKQKSAACAGCHGPDGKSTNDLWPNLAGQKRGYIIKQLRALKGGDRKDPLMTPMAATLSDQDIQDLADYFSSIK